MYNSLLFLFGVQNLLSAIIQNIRINRPLINFHILIGHQEELDLIQGLVHVFQWVFVFASNLSDQSKNLFELLIIFLILLPNLFLELRSLFLSTN